MQNVCHEDKTVELFLSGSKRRDLDDVLQKPGQRNI